MLRAAIIFFILGIVSMVLGVNNIAGLSIEIGKILLFVFLIFSVISIIANMLKGKKSSLIALAILSFFAATMNQSFLAQADDSVKKKVEEAGNDTKRGAKNTVREVKDKTCEMINGKMECAVQKVKHSVQKGADHVEDAID